VRIAIVGSGITGLVAAWALSQPRDGEIHEVVLYEAEPRLGGHSHTIDVTIGGQTTPVDTGFIVYNTRNYPHLMRIFSELGVETEESEMSFAVSVDRGAFEYSGSWRGLIGQPSNWLQPRYWKMMRDIIRFYKNEPARLADLRDARFEENPLTLRDLIRIGGYGADFADRHILPMAAAIWSSSVEKILDFPAHTFLKFFENHGLFSVNDRPQWRTVSGGSRSYVNKISAQISGGVRLNAPIASLVRTAEGVSMITASGDRDEFDQLVLATHPDQALSILGSEATTAERDVLDHFRYQPNEAVVHTDERLMPRRKSLWSSWNYITDGDDQSQAVCVTYWMNRLQNLTTDKPLLVSINPHIPVDEDAILQKMMYRHPVMDTSMLKGQGLLPEIQGTLNTWYCGAWCGYGFHEDGASAGLAVASALGRPLPWADDIIPISPAGEAVHSGISRAA